MITVTFKDNVTKQLAGIKKGLKNLSKDALVEMKALTPIKTGNARNKTIRNGDTLIASYPYAGKLDEGISNQAPDGITKPLDEWIGKEVARIIKDNP